MKHTSIDKYIHIKSIKAGFTLVEVMIATAMLLVLLIGLVQFFVYASSLKNLAINMTTVTAQAQSKMEEIRNDAYANITTDYASGGTPGNTFTLSQPTAKGIIYIDSSNASLLTVEIDVSWKNDNTRIIGEDTDLDGVLDAGEDLNSNGKLDSPVKIITYIAQR